MRSRGQDGAAGDQGFTLMEMMIVIAIIGLLLGAGVLGFRNVARTDLRSAASRLAATMRYAFDRATMTGDTLRLVLDIDNGELSLEASEDRIALRGGKRQLATTKADDADRAPSVESKEGNRPLPFGLGARTGTGAGGEGDSGDSLVDHAEIKKQYERDLKPAGRAKAYFQPVKPARKLKLAGQVKIEGLITPRLTEAVDKGKAYVYFFPQGHAEPAVVHLSYKGEDFYSVVLHPLTRQAKVYPCRYNVPADFGASDDKRARHRKVACAARGDQ